MECSTHLTAHPWKTKLQLNTGLTDSLANRIARNLDQIFTDTHYVRAVVGCMGWSFAVAHSAQRDLFLEGAFQTDKLQIDCCSFGHRLAVGENGRRAESKEKLGITT